jgi:hypothetical protein
MPVTETKAPATRLNIFELTYKKGYVMSKLYFGGTFELKTAIQRGKDYCTKRGLHFINVYEWLKDIDEMIGDPIE